MNLKTMVKQLRRERDKLDKRQTEVEYVLEALERMQRNLKRPYHRRNSRKLAVVSSKFPLNNRRKKKAA